MKINGITKEAERQLKGSYTMNIDGTTFKVRPRIQTSTKDIDKDGFTRVYTEVEINYIPKGFSQRKRIIRRYPTGVKIHPSNWHKKNQYIKGGTEAGFNDFKVKQHLLRIQTYLNDLQQGQTVDLPKELEELYTFFGGQKKQQKKGLIEYLDDYVEFRKSKNQKRGSWKEFLTLKNRLVKYNEYKKQELTFADMNIPFSFEFEQWMRNVPYEKKKIGKVMVSKYYDSNTIKKTFVTLKTFLNHYYDIKADLEEEIQLTDSFRNKKFGHIEGVMEEAPVPLTNEEFELLWKSNDKVDKDDTLSNVRLLVLLQCSVGCRVSDLFKLGQGKNKITDNSIIYYPTKTETIKKGHKNELVVPINKYSRYVLNAVDGDLSTLKMTDQHYNRLIKKLLKELKINSEVIGKDGSVNEKCDVFSSHNCRDTFITRCIEKGIPIPIVMDWTGQTSFEVMKKYFKADTKIKQDYMMKW